MTLELTREPLQVSENGVLGDYLKFSNGRTSPGDSPSGTKNIWGSNGVIGRTEESNSPENTIVIGRVGAYCGSVAFAKEESWVTDNAIKGSLHDTDDDPRFWYYKLSSMDLGHFSHGTSHPLINQTILNNLEVRVPPREERIRIAEILGSVDDKIEANSRLIQNLEELADLTFDRYLEDLSEVLEDITYGSLNFFGGGTPNTKTPDYWDGEVNWVTPTDVTSMKSHTLFESSRKITEAGLAACSSKLHPAGSIMMTSRATIGRFAVNQVPAATNQGFIVVQPANEYERWWIYHSMKKDVELFLLLANGATFLELSRRVFKDIPLKMFRGETELPAIHKQIIALEAENKGLIETRDLLIRHLIG